MAGSIEYKGDFDMDSVSGAGALTGSQRGRALARASCDALEAGHKRSFKAQRQILEDGFQSIAGDPNSSLDEKIVATMALKMQKAIPRHQSAVSASRIAMDTIACSFACSPGASAKTLGAVIAHLTHEAYISCDRSEHKSDPGPALLKTGVDALEMNAISKKEKALAGLGRAMLSSNHSYEAYQIMNVMSQPLNMPLAAHIAEAMIHTAGSGFAGRDSSKDALQQAFSAIDNSSLSSPAEKEVAQFGDSVLSRYGASKETMACAGAVMSELSRTLRGSTASVIAKAAVKSYPDLLIFLYETPGLDKVVGSAFSAIKGSPAAGEDDRRIAALGSSVMEKIPTGTAALTFSRSLLTALAYPPEKSRNHSIVEGAELGAAATSDLKEKKEIFLLAFRAIAADPSLNGEKKALAGAAVKVGEAFNDTQLAVDTMHDMAEQFVGRRKSDNLKEVEELMGGVKEDRRQSGRKIEMDDSVIDIDGVRLKRKSGRFSRLRA